MARTLELLFYRCLEIDHPATLSKTTPILRKENRAAAGRDEHILHLGQRIDHFALALAKPCFAFFFKNIRDIYPGALLDLHIAVDEGETQGTRNLPPHGSFAGAHGADQE